MTDKTPHDERQTDRNYDITRAFRRRIFPAVFAYAVLTMVAYELLHQYTTSGEALISMLFVCILLGIGIVGVAIRAHSKQLDATHFGYNPQDRPRPMFVIGSREYTRYRIDDGTGQGIIMGTGGHNKRRLQERERRQRDMECEVCHDQIGRGGGYFVETRRVYRAATFPIVESIENVDAYCADHKPRDFE